MKNLFILFAAILVSYNGFSQTPEAKKDTAVYLRFPTIPKFTVYKAPDSTAFSRDNLQKRKPTLFFIFSPDCGHCQHETEALIKDIKNFKNTQIVMITYLPYEEMIKFYKQYKIANYPQITMARDTKFFFPVFFKVQNLPSLFVYDKKGDFKKAFEGSVKMEDIEAEL
ncbi:MAG: redoxin domain-containing protein [Bacteroidota bacterium]|nr:redoxin domain-containing protein [Bacteroidota bacterium]